MRLLTTGSVANDHLMTFNGRFAEQLLPESLQRLSLSVLVDDLQEHRGGTGADVAYAAGQLGASPVLVAAVGADFEAGARPFLEAHGVDTRFMHVSATRLSARFVCTTDADGAQLGSFYPGAMVEAAGIRLAPIVDAIGAPDAVIVSANAPEAMLAHADECRAAGWPLWADPGQQTARFDGSELTAFMAGATYLFTNEYETDVLLEKTGLTVDDILERVGAWIVTLGANGSELRRRGERAIAVPVVPVANVADPTGAGDALRGGFAAALGWGLGAERALQVGATVSAFVVEVVGPQEYAVSPADVVARMRSVFGDTAADEVEAAVGAAVA